MNDLSGIGRLLAVVGVILVLAGALLMVSEKIQWIGRLPGDIYIKREKFSFYFPVATSILLSIVASIIFYFIGRK
jgi:hypothetical protein